QKAHELQKIFAVAAGDHARLKATFEKPWPHPIRVRKKKTRLFFIDVLYFFQNYHNMAYLLFNEEG
ncbi:MAG: hypothetical protein ACJ8CB_06650, partial [Ktedonobacteraceae bacterium]